MSTPIQSETLEFILTALHDRFASLSPHQGLRLRSSSNVEDLEGFNGAGLYSSESAFLFPHVQQSARDRSKTIDNALRRVWASYWSVEAVQERALEGIDHLEGWMAVLIHPHFQNDLELANGVMTLTLAPRNHHDVSDDDPHNPSNPDWIAKATLNSQIGSESVTHPSSPEILTELIEVKLYHEQMDDGEDEPELRLEINNLQRSSLEHQVLTENQVLEVVKKTFMIAEVWREAVNSKLTVTQKLSAFTLDFEYRVVGPTWPLQRSPTTSSPHTKLILKQARPLEPALPQLDDPSSVEHVPHDLLRRSSKITVHRCIGTQIEVDIITVYTDPLREPDVGFSAIPFISEMTYIDHRSEARQPSRPYRLTHRDFTVIAHRVDSLHEEALITLERREGRNLPFERLEVNLNTQIVTWSPRNGSEERESDEARINQTQCELIPLFASPEDYLQSLLEQAQATEGLGSSIER